MRSLALAAAALLASCAAAAAADLPRPPPIAVAPAPYMGWSGFYVGVNVGGGMGNGRHDFGIAAAPGFASVNNLIQGAIGGGQVGFNWQTGIAVVGVEADFQGTGIKGSLTAPCLPALCGLPLSATYSQKLPWFGTVRGRLGFLATPSLLIYGTGGLAYGRTEASGTVTLTAPAGPVGDFIVAGNSTFSCQTNTQKVCYTGAGTQTSLGWAAGGGFEHMITPNLTAKLEYLHVELAGQTVTLISPPPSVNAFVNYRFGRESVDLVRVGVNYKFGWTTGLPGPGR